MLISTLPKAISSNNTHTHKQTHMKYPYGYIKLFVLQAREEGKGGLAYIQRFGSYLGTMATRQKKKYLSRLVC